MFPYYREDLIRAEAEVRQRLERRNLMLRELRGAAPPFDGGVTRRLVAALAEQAGALRMPHNGSDARTLKVPCPDATEAMSS
jgi:hypothetical protein